jgi:hypothetical protein
MSIRTRLAVLKWSRYASATLHVGLLAFAAAACQRELDPGEAPAAEALAESARDSRGRPLLAPSDVTVHGVVLPEGLGEAYEIEGEPVYRTREKARRVVDYFAARYGREGLEIIGDGGIFRAVGVSVGDAPRQVDISVLARSTGGARVQVHLLPSPTEAPTGDAEARLRAYTKHLQTLD